MTHFTALFFIVGICVFHINAQANEKIRVVTEEWPPYNYTNDEGEVVGLATEVLKTVLREADIDYHIEMLSWSRAYKLAKKQSHTLIYTIYQAENRESQFQWICPLINTSSLNVYALKSRADITLLTLAELKQFTVGSTERSFLYDYLINQGFEVGKNLDSASDEEANIRKLFRGRIDLVAQEELPFKMRLAKAGLSFDDVKHVHTLFPNASNKSCMAMSLSTPKVLVEKIRKALQKVNDKRANRLSSN
ncbi:transporter substrate-binding domain-containing protein [Thalassotalea sp. M1531]|uniref:Transporter substrate-binding domain-containing protein n=1 Tax=Thalassotalea algicola TaxID=2716224 RepID=A0A7Y0Q5Z8_9GAMM|nr:transporter substrate-binding domain-containing protein [Thalassotalea algicola]NMP30651.1 transporter substrate-binding domain-containing protein [Thalassotalea algicola]